MTARLNILMFAAVQSPDLLCIKCIAWHTARYACVSVANWTGLSNIYFFWLMHDKCNGCIMQGVSEQNMVQIIAPAIKPLVSDRASAVKEACFASVASWLGASRSVLLLKWHVELTCSIHPPHLSALQADKLTSTRDATVGSSVQVSAI